MISGDGRRRVVIEAVTPEVNSGAFAIKRVVGEEVNVRADIFADGHDEVFAELLYRHASRRQWSRVPMRMLANDRWDGTFVADEPGTFYYTIHGWVDHFGTWRKDLRKKSEAGQDVKTDLAIGVALIERAAGKAGNEKERLTDSALRVRENIDRNLPDAVSIALAPRLAEIMSALPEEDLISTYERELPVTVDRKKALFSTWYELFPRSCTVEPGRHGTFSDCERLLPEIARMGFDVVYFPPVHPIGRTGRKGKNNSPMAGPEEPGSPWAIGAEEGGHKSVHPDLGTIEDFERLVKAVRGLGMEMALDLAFQCSRDHPYIKEHPEWFRWRPDGTIQYAENPPKKYEDIVPFDFETSDWRNLWEELRSVVLFWIEKGVRVFRVDNPHTKPFSFWEWLISEIKKEHTDAIFLAEAFTRPKVMYRLGKVGFTQSYTYFTWRTTKKEITEYLEELSGSEAREYFRPNFWPNTPDILQEYLQYGGRPAFLIRLVLAATLSSNYGIYGPAYQHLVNEPAPGREEYLDSEKYEVKLWEWKKPGMLNDFIARVNRVRGENAALQETWNVRFLEADNESIISYSKTTRDLSNVLVIAVNLDPFHRQKGRVRLPLEELGISTEHPYLVHDLLSDDKFIWQGEWNAVDLDPSLMPACIFSVRSRLRREQDFDYFM